MPDFAWTFLRQGARGLVRRELDLTVDGLEYVPAEGPVILAARHYHHLYDGCAVVATIPRTVHILVGLDWVEHPVGKRVMNLACSAARWPVVQRSDGKTRPPLREVAAAWRTALNESLELLAEGRVLLVFPEGYPTVDPGYTPKQSDDAFLPFQPGMVRLASEAAKVGLEAPIVPVGFAYAKDDRWRVAMRFGEPRFVASRAGEADVLRDLEEDVRRLSGLGELRR